MLFAQGWRLGFVAGTDNHQGHPTQNPGGYVGMTCFRATELTREAVWQAMDERWTYATSGVPIICDYAVNGVRSGAEGALAEGEKVHFSASLHGTAPIERVEIIANGQCVWQGAPNAWDVEIDGAELPAPDGRVGLLLSAAAATGRAPGVVESSVVGSGMNGTRRADIGRGIRVAIVQKQDQRTGRLTEGVVQDILTKSATHPHGIKVRLATGEVGRVKQVRG